jgi:hypothetical protein
MAGFSQAGASIQVAGKVLARLATCNEVSACREHVCETLWGPRFFSTRALRTTHRTTALLSCMNLSTLWRDQPGVS